MGEPIGSTYIYGGYSLSDNSFLSSIASFGLVVAIAYWALLAVGIKSVSKGMSLFDPLTMLVVFLCLSDFVQLYPSSYFALILILPIYRKGADQIGYLEGVSD